MDTDTIITFEKKVDESDPIITFEKKVDESGTTRLYAIIRDEKCDDADKKIVGPIPSTDTWWYLLILLIRMNLQKKDERTD